MLGRDNCGNAFIIGQLALVSILRYSLWSKIKVATGLGIYVIDFWWFYFTFSTSSLNCNFAIYFIIYFKDLSSGDSEGIIALNVIQRKLLSPLNTFHLTISELTPFYSQTAQTTSNTVSYPISLGCYQWQKRILRSHLPPHCHPLIEQISFKSTN